MAYLGLDIGTTGCKASIIDKKGQLLFSTSQEYDLLFPGGGRIEICPDTIWEACCAVISKSVIECGHNINSISIASFGESVVILDKNDKSMSNSIFYTDIRGTKEINDILLNISAGAIYKITGMPLNSMYSLNKLLWIQKHQHQIINEASKIFLYGDYIGYKLTGERIIDFSLASRTMMFDCSNKKWSKILFDTFMFDMNLFSIPKQAGSVVGNIKKSLCKKFGLSENVILILGGHDQACAALGVGAIEPGDCCDSFGSAECLSIVMKKSKINSTMRIHNYCCEPHLIPGKYITLAFNSSAGATLKWYRNTIENDRYIKLTKDGQQIYSVLDSECDEAPTSILFFPYMVGSGTPDMNSLASAAYHGITINTTKPEFYKAIMEGICLDMKYNLELLNATGVYIENIYAVGGGAHSKTLLQIKSDVLGKPIKTLSVSEAGTLGLAILCAVACGDYIDYSSAIKEMITINKSYNPIENNNKIYNKKYMQFKEIRKTKCNIIRLGEE